MSRIFLALVTLVMAGPASAGGWVDARYADASLEIDSDDENIEIESESSDGVDLRAQIDVGEQVFVRGEYLGNKDDNAEINGVESGRDFSADFLRFGVGLRGGSTFRYYGTIEFAKVDFEIGDVEDDDKGLILAGGLEDAGKGAFLWNVELGLVEFDDSDGVTLDITLGYRITPTFAIVAGGGGYTLEDGANTELDVTPVSVGIRLNF